ncbi:sigma-54-dependent Fis family transcriptional regulator [bacterium]|nr:sigma-54-dependent Fis family transcriptional regulator [bacterium]
MEKNIKINSRANILIVDDEVVIQKLFSDFLANSNFSLFCASNNQEAREFLMNEDIDVMLLDVYMGQDSGIDLIPEARKISTNTDIVVISGTSRVSDVIKVMKYGVADFLLKPIKKNELLDLIDKIVGNKSNYLDIPKSDDIYLGESPIINELAGRIQVIAPTNLNVLITGKSGTGKEVFAKMLFQQSKRAKKPFVAVDCGAIPETLIENELFGSAKGAFTGAHGHKGKFELADQGTILLDEITNLPLSSQAKLLRAIQEKKFYPIGSNKEIHADFRIIATTNVDCGPLIKQGLFREDLYYRLNEISIEIPDLNEREEDFEKMALFFVNKANKELNKHITGLSSDAVRLLQNHKWKGNIREFKHVIFTATLYCPGSLISPEHLSINKKDGESNSRLSDQAGFYDVLKKTEKDLILEALDKHHWNKSETAKELKINRKTLYRKITELKIADRD